MAVWGVLKPMTKGSINIATLILTKADLFVESNTTGGLLCLQFFGVQENADLLLESFFVLDIHVRFLLQINNNTLLSCS